MMTPASTSQPWLLSLDLGVASIGWVVAALDPDDHNKVTRFIDAGVRIFPSPLNQKTKTSLAANRTTHRQARKQLSRRSQRLRTLRGALVDHHIWDDRHADETLPHQPGTHQGTIGYRLRSEGLERPLTLVEFGAAIMSLAVRRGPSFDLKTDPTVAVAQKGEDVGKDLKEAAKDTKVTKAAIKATKELLDGQTPGQWCWKILSDPSTDHRFRNTIHTLNSSSRIVFHRDMIVNEFDRLWEYQNRHHPQLDDTTRNTLRNLLKSQRPLKPVLRGTCPYEQSEYRIDRAHPAAQAFRLTQTVNNLSLYDAERENRKRQPLTMEQRDLIHNHLSTRLSATAQDLLTLIELPNIQFSKNVTTIKGNTTTYRMGTILGFDVWGGYSRTIQADIVNHLTDLTETSETTIKHLAQYGIDNPTAHQLIAAGTALEKGVAQHGETASWLLADELMKPDNNGFPLTYNAAVANIYNTSHTTYIREGHGGPLTYYGQALPLKVMPVANPNMACSPLETEHGRISNTVVHVTLGELRKIFNTLHTLYGPPTRVNVETSRELSKSADERAQETFQNRKRQKINETLAKEIATTLGYPDGYTPTDSEMQRWRLYKELLRNGGPTAQCVYSGKTITARDALNGHVTEVDHIIPFSRSKNSKLNNLVLVRAEENQHKRDNQTPFDAFGHNPTQWKRIQERVDRCFTWVKTETKNGKKTETKIIPLKAKRFDKDHIEDPSQFLNRSLNDTRYMTKIARAYLATAVGDDNILCPVGALTHETKHQYGLHTLIAKQELRGEVKRDDGTIETPGTIEWVKNRDDHRHHVVDAFAIALINRSMIRTAALNNHHKPQPANPSAESTTTTETNTQPIQEIDPLMGANKPPTWVRTQAEQFLNTLNVSHRPNHDPAGQFVEKTIYSIVTENPETNTVTLGVRKLPSNAGFLKDKPLTQEEALRLLNNPKGYSYRDNLMARKITKQHKQVRASSPHGDTLHDILLTILTDPKLKKEERKTRIAALDRYGTIRGRTAPQSKTGLEPVTNKHGTIIGYRKRGSNYCAELINTDDGFTTQIIPTITALTKDFKTHLQKNPHKPYKHDGMLRIRLIKNDLVTYNNTPTVWRIATFSSSGSSHSGLQVTLRPAHSSSIDPQISVSTIEGLQSITPHHLNVLGKHP